MFKNAILYRIDAQPFNLSDAVAALASHAFSECSPSQEESAGWAPARGEAHGPMIEAVGGHWIAKFQTETKTIPAAVLRRKVDERLREIEASTGRKPGRKETKELKEDIVAELLPMAFSKIAATWVWIDPANRLLLIDTSTQARADQIVSALVMALPEVFSVSMICTQTHPQAAMARWLFDQEAPPSFTVDRELELRSTDESKATVRYGSHPLDISEIREHIQAGKVPTRLALTWNDRISLVLTHGMRLTKLAFLDVKADEGKENTDAFDADVAIATGELSRLIPALLEALDGEASFAQPDASAQVAGIDLASDKGDVTAFVEFKGARMVRQAYSGQSAPGQAGAG